MSNRNEHSRGWLRARLAAFVVIAALAALLTPALPGQAQSSDPTLSNLQLFRRYRNDQRTHSAHNVALSPVFAAGVTSYTAEVPRGVDNITIRPTLADAADSAVVARTSPGYQTICPERTEADEECGVAVTQPTGEIRATPRTEPQFTFSSVFGSRTINPAGNSPPQVGMPLELGRNTFEVRLTDSSSNTNTYSITIYRGQVVTLTTNAADGRVNESAGTVSVTATLNSPAPSAGVAVTLVAQAASTASTADYTLPAAFTIANGQTSASANIAIVDDSVIEIPESIVVGANAGQRVVENVTVLIDDNDTIGGGITTNESTLSTEPLSTVRYTVALAVQPTGTVTVTASTNNPRVVVIRPTTFRGYDPDTCLYCGGFGPRTLTFTRANWNTAQSVALNALEEGEATISHTAQGGGYDSVPVNTIPVTVAPPQITTTGISGASIDVTGYGVPQPPGDTNTAPPPGRAPRPNSPPPADDAPPQNTAALSQPEAEQGARATESDEGEQETDLATLLAAVDDYQAGRISLAELQAIIKQYLSQ